MFDKQCESFNNQFALRHLNIVYSMQACNTSQSDHVDDMESRIWSRYINYMVVYKHEYRVTSISLILLYS